MGTELKREYKENIYKEHIDQEEDLSQYIIYLLVFILLYLYLIFPFPTTNFIEKEMGEEKKGNLKKIFIQYTKLINHVEDLL